MVPPVLGPDDGDSEGREEVRGVGGRGGGVMGGKGRGPRGVPDTLWGKALRDSELFKDTYYLGV